MFIIVIKCINIACIYFSQMPLLIYYRSIVEYDISLTCILIAPVPN